MPCAIALADLAARGITASDGPVVVLTGDTPLLTGRTLVGLLLEHDSTSAAATVLTARLDDPTGYGRIVRAADGSVTAIVEEKDADRRPARDRRDQLRHVRLRRAIGWPTASAG